MKKVADDLAPYRRLVELQKQMIELAQQHEQSKRRRTPCANRWCARSPTGGPSAAVCGIACNGRGKTFEARPGFCGRKPNLGAFNPKQPSSC